jgi:glycosyltransferase involved in cell wall biosynthesis
MISSPNKPSVALVSLHPVTVVGGGENYTKNCAKCIASFDGKCDLFYPVKDLCSGKMSHEFRCSTFSQSEDIQTFDLTFTELLNTLSGYQIVWIHQYLAYPEVYNILLSTHARQSVVFTNHGLEMNANDFWHRYEKFPNHVFLEVSDFSASRTKKYIKDAAFVYGGIWKEDLDKYSGISSPKRTDHFVAIGRVLPHKGFEISVSALNRKQHLDVLGPKNIHSTYQKFLTILSLFKDVKFLGHVTEEQKLKVLVESTALIASSASKTISGRECENSELLGIVILEAIAAGTLPIASFQPAFKEIMTTFQLTEFLYPERDSASLRQKIEFVNRLSLEQYSHYIEKARSILAEHFLWDDYWPRVQKVLSKV